MSRLAPLATLTFAAIVAACFNPTFNNPACGPNGECPSGTTCVQNVCRSDAPDIDAPIDTSDIDSPPGDPDAAMPDAAPNDGQIDASIDARIDAPTDAAPIDSPTDGPPIDAPLCPNGTTNAGEECDDGNLTNTDNCTATCRFNVCGDGHLDTVTPRTDTCDDGNTSNTDNCVNVTVSGTPNQCRPSSCGDGFTDTATPGIEQCDDGNQVNNDGCKNDCTLPVCGDGVVSGSETCDPGQVGLDTATCDRDCTPPVCGDTLANAAAGEQCDDGNAVNTDACLNTCLSARCGDGFIRSGVEACDDGNNSSCGTCTTGCTTSIIPTAATGMIQEVQAGQHFDQDWFQLMDGFNPPVVFEYDMNGFPNMPGAILIPIGGGGGPGQVASQVSVAINNLGGQLLITASSVGGGQVMLTHDRLTTYGNQPIMENVSDPAWFANGMNFGATGDCPPGEGCRANDDCGSGVCRADGTCQ